MSIIGEVAKEEFKNLPRNIRSGITFLVIGGILTAGGLIFNNRVVAAEEQAKQAVDTVKEMKKTVEDNQKILNEMNARGQVNQQRIMNVEGRAGRIEQQTDRIESKIDRVLTNQGTIIRGR